jgi:glycosyltransferase involved in cell wall biosynthesis
MCVENLERGGIQRQMLEVARAMVGRGDQVTVATMRVHWNAMKPDFEEAGVRVVALHKRPRIRFIYRLRRLFAGSFDIIHAMSPTVAAWCAIALPRFSSSVFLSSWLNTHALGAGWKRFVEREIVAPRADGVFVNSQLGASMYRRVVPFEVPTKAIHNGVSTELHSTREAATERLASLHLGPAFSVGCTARLVPVKGIDRLLAAAGLLADEGRSLTVNLVGGGELHQRLLAQSAVLPKGVRVVFHGDVAEPRLLLPAFDAFVLPSHSEGLPNALLEAMAEGLPSIATKVGGIPEVITDGVDGLLVDGSPESIASALRILMDDPVTRERLAIAGQGRVRSHFSLEAMCATTLKWYDDALRMRRTPLAYVVSQFPKLSESFVLREVVELKRQAVPLTVLTLKHPAEKVRHGDAPEVLPTVVDRPFFALSTILAALAFIRRHPLRTVRAFGHLYATHCTRPRELAKAVASTPKLLAFASILRRRRVRHLHVHWANLPTALGQTLAGLLDASFSFTAHAHDIYRNHYRLPQKIRAASFVATCTERNVMHLRSLVTGRKQEQIHLVRHFLNSVPCCRDAERSFFPTTPHIVSVGTIAPYKGFDLLIRAVSQLHREQLDATVQIIGPGDSGPLRHLAAELGVAQLVSFSGPLPQHQVFEALRTADVFCLASRQTESGSEDNLPNVLVEAALARVPVVGTRVGSVHELIVDGDHGLLAEPNSVESLTEALRTALSDGDASRRRAERLARHAESLFGRTQNLSVLLEAFRSVPALQEHLP